MEVGGVRLTQEVLTLRRQLGQAGSAGEAPSQSGAELARGRDVRRLLPSREASRDRLDSSVERFKRSHDSEDLFSAVQAAQHLASFRPDVRTLDAFYED